MGYTVKIPKISPGAYSFQRPFLRGLCTEGNLRFKIDWASLIFGKKFTVFPCLTLYYRTISKYKPGIPYNAALDYLYTYKFSNVKVLAKVFDVDNNMGFCSGKEKLVESKTRYQIFLCLPSSHLLFLFPRYRVLRCVL